jgi:hypothetical protein
MFVKTKNKNRVGTKVAMKNIVFDFDSNGVAEIDDSHKEVVSKMTGHPFNLKVLVDYDPLESERKEYEKKLKSLNKSEVVGIASENGIETITDTGKEINKIDLIKNILSKLI